MFEAFWLTVFMVCWAVFRRLRQCVMCKGRCEQSMRALLMTDYVVLYGVLFGFLCYLIVSMYVHLAQYGWLNPDALEARFPELLEVCGRGLMANSTGLELAENLTASASDSSSPDNLLPINATATATTTLTASSTTLFNAQQNCISEEEAMHIEAISRSLSIRPIPVTRALGILAPWIVLVTWCVCAYGTWKHAREIWSRTGVSKHHDLVIQILALPMVYSLMALSAVLRMWELMSNSFGDPDHDWFHSWDTWQAKALQIYEADYAVADLYESWALHHFAVLSITLLKHSFHSASEVLQRSAALIDVNSPMFQAWAGTLKGMHKSVSNLAMLGIWSFVISCACGSCYVLGAVMVQEVFGDDSTWGELVRRNAESMRMFTKGMGCVASSVAICNILQIERTFRIELMSFGPFLKFWGTKVLVSIAFLQNVVFMIPVPPFKDMSTVQANVTYSSLICYECLLISLLHMYAWRANEDWYRDDVPPSQLGPPRLSAVPTNVLGQRIGLKDSRADNSFAGGAGET